VILCRRAHLSPVVGAITGSISAGIGASVISYSRSWLSKVTKLPDPLWGGLEDILALGLGFFAVRKSS
jgi:hypothetical protein